jgi:lysophospholipase L1-like esterase
MRRNLLWAGALAALGLLINPWTVTLALVPSGRTLPVEAKGVIWLFEFLCLGVAAIIWGRRRSSGVLRQSAFGALTVVLMLMALELGLHAGQRLLPWVRLDADPRHRLPQYEGKPWAEAYWREYRRLKETPKRFEPHVLWVTQEFHGVHINVDASGRRRTWNPGPERIPDNDALFILGGSTVWGTGARDEETLPSALSKLLHAEGFDLSVENFGEMAYTFTQAVVRLTLLLRAGERPRFVIFCDGFNDVYAAYQSGRAGSIQNLSQMREKVSASGSELLWLWLSDIFRNRCLTVKAAGALAAALSTGRAFPEQGHAFSEAQLSQLARDVVEEYARSLSLLDALARSHGFDYACFWQPTAPTEQTLHPEERAADPRIHDPGLAALLQAARRELKGRALAGVFDLSGALDGRPGPVYIDVVHLTGEGNARVAAAMLPVVRQGLGRPRPPRVESRDPR